MLKSDEAFMRRALQLAQKAQDQDEVPVGAVVVYNQKIIGRGYNRRQTKQNALEHAELMAIAQACRKLHSWRLEDCTLYVTLEPCPMCAGAIIQSRLTRVIFGAYDPKGGAVAHEPWLLDLSKWNHHPTWKGGLLEEECSTLLKSFFQKKRLQKKLQKKSQEFESHIRLDLNDEKKTKTNQKGEEM